MKGVDIHTLHAEMNVLRFSEPGDKLVVYRFNALGEPTMAKPCLACQKFLKEAGISDVEYSDWDGSMKEL